MVINSQHNSTDVASSLVAGMMGTLLALVLALALAQGERKPYLLEASCRTCRGQGRNKASERVW